MKNIESLSEVKPHSQLAQLKAKLKGIGGRHRYGRFTREQIETLKLALVPHLLSICQRLFPYGVLSRTGEYWVIPALEITVNLETGDFFPWPFEPGRRIGDFIFLYIDYSGLSFRQAAAALGAIAADIEKAPLPPFPADGKSTQPIHANERASRAARSKPLKVRGKLNEDDLADLEEGGLAVPIEGSKDYMARTEADRLVSEGKLAKVDGKYYDPSAKSGGWFLFSIDDDNDALIKTFDRFLNARSSHPNFTDLLARLAVLVNGTRRI